MNRIILFGNGFDLSHNLNTRYTDFINDFWNRKANIFLQAYYNRLQLMRNIPPFKDDNFEDDDLIIYNVPKLNVRFDTQSNKQGFELLEYYISTVYQNQKPRIKFKNLFLEQINHL